MDSEKLEHLRLATAYSALAGSLAYLDLIDWLETECKRAELEVAQIPVSDSEKWPMHFMHWQRLVEVTQSIKNRVSTHLEFKTAIEEEIQNERPHSEQYPISGDSALPGY